MKVLVCFLDFAVPNFNQLLIKHKGNKASTKNAEKHFVITLCALCGKKTKTQNETALRARSDEFCSLFNKPTKVNSLRRTITTAIAALCKQKIRLKEFVRLHAQKRQRFL